MDLFNQNNKLRNLLPKDGAVYYYGCIFNSEQAEHYYDTLLTTIDWKADEAIMFGKRIITKRKVAWYGEKEFEYHYSNITKVALPFSELLLEIKSKIEEITKESYNSCLLNLYHDGSEGMGWHADGETTLEKSGAIASVSFGATRKFGFKHKESKETVYKILEHGSVLVMRGETQTHWLHRLPPTKMKHRARVNLTFRTIVT